MNAARSLLLLAAAALSLAGCADTDRATPTSPGLAPGEAMLSASHHGPDLTRLAKFHSPPSVTIAWARKWIGPDGGRLEFQGFAIDVPAGAVDRVTQFSIRLPVDPQGSERVVAEFGPHAGTFAVPVTIELPYVGTSIEGDGYAPTVVWWNPDVSSWVDVGGALTADGQRISTRTGHFSLYGSTSLSSGGVTTSGGRSATY